MVLVRPSMRALAPALRDATLAIATRLRSRGRQAWLVGGAVRDMALGKSPKDIDIATDAAPDEVEALFERTTAVGKAFGTIVVLVDGVESQVTTFRSELGHHDARRPSSVTYGADLREDAARRDFTCNALYLDPLDDTLADPFGGLEDLAARRLRTVGEPHQRFAEDGLRLVRMARLAAAHELEVDAATYAAARESVAALRGVSAERRHAELVLIFQRREPSRALRLLEGAAILEPLCPGVTGLAADDLGPAPLELRWRALEVLGDAPGPVAGFGVLFDARCGRASVDAGAEKRGLDLLRALRPARALLDAVGGAWRAQRRFHELSVLPAARRSARVRLARDPRWPVAAVLLRAWGHVHAASVAALDDFERWVAALTPGELRPAPWLGSDDLADRAIPRGPDWKRLLDAAEDLQLDGALTSRAAALEWLAAQARELRGER